MEQLYHPFFSQFSAFLNDLDTKTTKSSNETVVPPLVVTHSDHERIVFEKDVYDLNNQTNDLFEHLKNVPSATSFVDTASSVLDITLKNIEQISHVLQQFDIIVPRYSFVS